MTANMRILSGLLAAIVLGACTPAPAPTATPTASPRPTETVEPTETNTPRPTATHTPTYTPTATATATRRPVTAAPTATSDQNASATPDQSASATPTTAPVADFVPPGDSLWQLDYSPFNVSRTDACPGELVIDFYGRIAVTSGTDGITWRRPDGSSYSLARLSPNNYAGGGVAPLAGYNLSIAVTFLSETTLTVTYTLIPQDNTNCNYIYQYNGVKL